MQQRFKDSQMQAAYAHARTEGVPREGSSIYIQYLAGLGVRRAPTPTKDSLAYAWWRAGADNLADKVYGARDVETLTRLGIELPFPAL